jgi:putative transposase
MKNQLWQPKPYIDNLRFEESQIYHVYNRANGNELLFYSDDNYYFFLRKIKQYLTPVCAIYALCLMPNHYHLLIRIKDTNEAKGFIQSPDNKVPTGKKNEAIHEIISMQFRRLQISYAKALNKQKKRKGSLFIQNIKRRNVDSEKYFVNVLRYIHYNPVASGLTYKPYAWKFSSYKSLFENKGCCRGWIAKNELLVTIGEKEEIEDFLQTKEAVE